MQRRNLYTRSKVVYEVVHAKALFAIYFKSLHPFSALQGIL
jgi:hypothetical protein